MVDMLVVRHAESTWNAERRWSGQADPPLTTAGRAGARGLADALGGFGFDTVVTSDLQRARETGEILARALGLAPPRLEAGLRERDMGRWTGLTRAEIEGGWPGWLERWRREELAELPGAETREAFDERVRLAVLGAGTDAERGLVVAHAGTLRALERHCGMAAGDRRNLGGMWLELDAGAIGWMGPGPA